MITKLGGAAVRAASKAALEAASQVKKPSRTSAAINAFFTLGLPAWSYADGTSSAGGALGSSLGFAAGDALGRRIGRRHPLAIPMAAGMAVDYLGGKLGDKLWSTKRMIKTPMGPQDRATFAGLEKTSSFASTAGTYAGKAGKWASKKIRGVGNGIMDWILGIPNLHKPYDPKDTMIQSMIKHPITTGIAGLGSGGALWYVGNKSFNNTQQAVDNYYQNYGN